MWTPQVNHNSHFLLQVIRIQSACGIHYLRRQVALSSHALTIESMPKRRDDSKAPDRHKANFMVRLPIALAAPLDVLVEQHLSDRTTEVIAAVREYLERRELWPPSKARRGSD